MTGGKSVGHVSPWKREKFLIAAGGRKAGERGNFSRVETAGAQSIKEFVRRSAVLREER